jgi:RNA polymerase sigma-70 factor (ECF subfamily)
MARVTLNLILDHLRRKKSIIMEDFSTIETPAEEVDIEQVKSLSFDEILSLMERLSPMKRVVFNLYYVENCTHREIASMLGIKEKTSSSILFKARTDLMNIIKYNK